MRPLALFAALVAPWAAAQPDPADLASPEALVQAAYEVIHREPGGDYDWPRARPLFLPQAVEIPNTEQTGGPLAVLNPEAFRRLVSAATPIGGPDDHGFQEEQTHATVHRYGDVAQVFSAYQKHDWGSDEITGRGINAFQLVRQPGGAWKIVSIIWDEEEGAGPIPARYGGSGADRPETDAAVPSARFGTPEAVVDAAYAVIQRRPGDRYDWDLFRSLFLPQASLVPNTEQSEGAFTVLTPGGFAAWVDRHTPYGTDQDRGFAEEEVHRVVERYGDVAQVFSTYKKRFYDSDEVLGRGINSFQLVRHDGRWWIVGIVWDEEYGGSEQGGGPIPDRYLARY